MRHGSLFTGIGGFNLAAEWMGWENVFQVEIDKFCQKVLAKNFPNVKRYGNIKEFDGTKYKGLIDIISGGFPCQPFSQAGKRKGKSDDRYLWPEMLRVIGEIKPSFIVGENVGGLLSMENGKTLDKILSDLENKGYTTEQIIIPACASGAWHRRDRIWILAYSFDNVDRARRNETGKIYGIQEINREKVFTREFNGTSNVTNSNSKHGQKLFRGNKLEKEIGKRTFGRSYKINRRQWESEPSVGRVADGIPHRMDRLKGLGNAIVPQVVYQIFKAIEQYEDNLNVKSKIE